jgi:TM2 domain-containing membrane protein YozV
MPGMPMAPMAMPGAPYGVDPVTGLPFSDKSKIIAGILQLVLGSFGAGRFYTGHIGLAIAQIAVAWCTCGFGLLWPLIDGIMMLTGRVTDAEGRPLRDGT